MKKNYKIFDKIVQICLIDDGDSIIKNAINRTFSFYEDAKNETPHIIINVGQTPPNNKIISVNPKNHFETEKGFICKYPKFSVSFRYDKILTVDLSLNKQKRTVRYLKKLYNIQYNSIDERVYQIIYELILVPFNYFIKENSLIHSSAFIKDDGAILIGGTGGVGKTSLEIELCMNKGYSFIADDISIVDKNGFIHPNLAFPKIYAYNLKNNKKLKSLIFKNRNFFDKAAWKIKFFLNGPSGVRRDISPFEAFGSFQTEKTKIKKYYILIKKDVEKIRIQKISTEKACELTLLVIKNEYRNFNSHIYWHQYNCSAINKDPILKLNEVFLNWEKTFNLVFNNIDCYIINIPIKINHKDFIEEVANII